MRRRKVQGEVGLGAGSEALTHHLLNFEKY